MLMRTDPFRELERLTEHVMGTRTRPAVMPLDAYRDGERFVVHFDLPGVDHSTIDLTVEKNVLTVTAERSWKPTDEQQVVVAERPQGRFQRQLFLGESLDADRVEADYEGGVLTVTIPMAERAKARKIEIGGGNGKKKILETSSSESDGS